MSENIIVVATHNKGKLAEFRRILSPLGYTVKGLTELGHDSDFDETGETFTENAIIKASGAFKLTSLPSIADDSGLCIDALGGKPGVQSARFLGEDVSYPEKMAKIVDMMESVPQSDRTARFTCAIVYTNGDEQHVFEHSCEGYIGHEPIGEKGFGYDPIFMVGDKSFATMSDEEKDSISHRGKALRAFSEFMTIHK